MSGHPHVQRRRRLLRSLRRRQLLVELLEDRRLLSVFTVNSAGDEPDWLPGDGKATTITGTTTLRAAIMEANASVGKDVIEFNIPGAGPHVFQPATRFPAMIDPISIDGYSQPGASPTSQTLQEGNNAVIKIELDGSLLPLGTNGLEIFGGQSEVRGLAIHSFYGKPVPNQEFLGTTIVGENGAGIWLWSGGNSQIVGNFLGATASGQVPAYPRQPGTASSGIMVGSYDNVIQENLVVGNQGAGVVLGSKFGDTLARNVHGNKVYGNYIGMEQDGRTPLSNTTGVIVCWGAYGNEIGGGSANFGNLISGNTEAGISIIGVGPGGTIVGGNVIQRNLIGTDRSGKLTDPDNNPNSGDETGNRHVGIQIDRSLNNLIGGTAADAGNVISGNLGGVLIVEPQSQGNQIIHNKVGTDVDGKVALPNKINGIDIQKAPKNRVASNLLSGNSGAGIYIEGPGATANTIEDNLIGTDASGTKKLGNEFGGIDIIKASDNIVRRNTISGSSGFGAGVTIEGSDAGNNRVSENRIGTDVTGLNALGNTGAGVVIVGGSENTIDGNTISANRLSGIFVDGSTAKRNHIFGNRIGTDVSGTATLGNGLDGIWIQNAPENQVGGTDPAQRNVIAGNDRDGIRISGKTATGNQVFGNYIGTNLVGNSTLPNSGSGIYVENAPQNVIGGEMSNRRNIISGNLGSGVAIVGADALRNKVQGNYIGTNTDGTGIDLGNAADGVLIDKAVETLIGGNAPKLGEAPGNLIAGNWKAGVHIKGSLAIDNKVRGNVIGRDKNDAALGNATHGVFIENAPQNVIGEPSTTNAPAPSTGNSNVISANLGDGIRISGNTAVRNLIRRNEIYDNTKLGINLVGGDEQLRPTKDGVTPNDVDDPSTPATDPDSDNGPNTLMNFPVGVTAWFDGADTIISGVLDTTQPDNATVDLYANRTINASGFGDGRYYLGSVRPEQYGAFRLTIPGPLVPPANPGVPADAIFISATASSPDGSTSEFSPVYGDPDGDGKIDSDGDGLPDEWETNGIDFNGDGKIDLDLHKLGADPAVKDVFVEIDYMRGSAYQPTSIARVTSAFRNAPVDNGVPFARGIVLHVNTVAQADTIPFSATPVKGYLGRTAAANDDFWDLKRKYFGSAADRGSPNRGSILGARALVYHYTVVVADVHEAPGWGELQGDDFINKKEDTWDADAVSFMHELGHNLGLDHGGPISRDAADQMQSGINYKPNQLSVMNYWYTFLGYVARRPLDYSVYRGDQLGTINEVLLDERFGITGGMFVPGMERAWPQVAFSYSVNGIATAANAPSSGPIDWNRTFIIEPFTYSANIHDEPAEPSTGHLANMQSREEWNHLRYNFRAGDSFEGVRELPDSSFVAQVARTLDSDGDGINNTDDNVAFVFNPDQLDSDGDGIGDAGELVSLALSHTSVSDGALVTGTVTLLLPAPDQGALIELFSDEPWMVNLPQYVVISAGARTTSFQFPVTALNLDPTKVAVYASYGLDVVETALTIGPAGTTADLSLALAGAPEPVGLGGIVTYTLDVTNQGPETVTGVTLTDTLPAGAVLRAAAGTVPEQVPGPGLHVRFDYTYDTSGFFDTQAKKDVLQLAGDTFLSAMGDDLAAIAPGAGNTWTAIFPNPATGAEERITDLIIPENEIVVYVGARDLGDSGTGIFEGALAGPGSLEASGTADFSRAVNTRGERGADKSDPTDFGPWGGTITFNTNPAARFSFDDEAEPNEFDIFTVALHEMAHVLGLGTSESWQTYVDAAQGVFRGPASRLEYDAGGDVPLAADTLAHWREGITESGEPVLMDPLLPQGTRLWYPTALDWAGLADVGWNIDGMLTVERPITFTDVAGAVIGQIGVLEPGQIVTITLEVQPTLAGTIHNVATVSGYGHDPDLSNNTAETFGTVTPLVLIVNTTDDVDDGVVDATHTSLREAINAANNAPGTNTISFNIPGPGPHVIRPTSPLPVITDPIVIDATTEPDYAGTPMIELSGALAGRSGNGLTITAGSSTIRALVIDGFQSDGRLETGNAILLKTGDGNVLEGCYLGTDVSGTLAQPNAGAGLLVWQSTNNLIGGHTPDTRNVISGNQRQGILLGSQADNNLVVGNYIGVDAAGNAALGNLLGGVEIIDASDNHVGDLVPAARNVISGNAVGVRIRGTHSMFVPQANRVQGNYLGTNAAGDAAVGNGIGVSIVDADRNIIGGTTLGAGNTISGNDGAGIEIMGYGILGGIAMPPSFSDANQIIGNMVGLAADAVSPLGNGSHGVLVDWGGNVVIGGSEIGAANTIAANEGDGIFSYRSSNFVARANSIFDNAGLGIDVGADGVTPNPSAGAAAFYYPANYPELTRAFTGAGSTTIEGAIAGPQYPAQGVVQENVLDFYATPVADPSGHGEGSIYLGSISTYPRGTASFSARFPVEVPFGYVVTATGTREYRTSEFSLCIDALPDADGDGVFDAVEDAGPNGGDANDDGVPDSVQNEIASLPNAVDGEYVVLEVALGGTLRDVRAWANPSPCDGPPGVDFPSGFFSLMVAGGPVTIYPPYGQPIDTVYNFGATRDRLYDHWYQFPANDVEINPDNIILDLSGVSPSTRIGPASILSAGTTLIVNSVDDADDGQPDNGHTTLREAINLANYLPGRDTIAFEIPGPGPHAIRPLGWLPWITDAVLLDGYSQPGAVPATEDAPATILIELDGSLTVTNNGLALAADDSVVRGLAINRFNTDRNGYGGGVQIEVASDNNIIEGNYIGTDPSGTVAYRGSGYAFIPKYGLEVFGSGNVIGGTTPAARNVISGLTYAGVYVYDEASHDNQILGNFIGTDATGTRALGNDIGVHLDVTGDNVVGGILPGARNLISGNDWMGVAITGYTMDSNFPGNLVQGNFIGTDVTGTRALGNDVGIGINCANNIIGGTDPAARNVISGNLDDGIELRPYEGPAADYNVVQGNFIGVDVTGSQPLPNSNGVCITGGRYNLIGGTAPGAGNVIAYNAGPGVDIYQSYWHNSILGNSIYANADPATGWGLGIDISWLNPNDPRDYDAPQMNSVVVGTGGTTITSTLESDPNTTYRVEFFSSPEADVSGYGEGQTFLYAADVTTDNIGWANITISLPTVIPLTYVVTATATDLTGGTSAFSDAMSLSIAAADFGDAADPRFPTRLASNGARHALGSELYLGWEVDAEEDGQSSESADGDDATGTDDEDGVVFLSPLVPGQPAAIEVTASAHGRLDAWIDFADNGTWSDAEDHVFDGVTLLPGLNTLFFEVPPSAIGGTDVFSRFRFSTTGGLNFDGPAVDGEVEDYLVVIDPLPTDNRSPTAVDDAATTAVDVPVAIDVTANDSDPEGFLDPRTVTVTVVPTSGSVFVDPASGVITYISSIGFTGDDEFTYRVADAQGLVDTARVTVHVLPGNRPPVAVADSATTDEEVPVVIDVLANDRDPDDGLDPTTVVIIAPPAHGTVQVDAQSGAVTYTPDADYFGADRLVYAVSDTQGVSARAMIAITVQSLSDPPRASDDLAQTDQDVPVVLDVLANDSDADGDLDPTSVSLGELPQHGLAEVDSVTGRITYTPAPGFSGMDTFRYRVLDATENAATATVRIEVLPTSYPPDAVDDAADTPEDTPVSIDVAVNDTDVDGDLDPGSVRILVGPSRGTAQVDPGTRRIVFTPDEDFVGNELLWYEIHDARGQSDIGLVHITVTPVNDPPVARDDTAIILRDMPTDLYVLSNDTDVDSLLDRATLRIETGPNAGSVAIQADGSVRYTPRTGFTGTDQFRYTVRDDAGARSNVAVVTITVEAEPTMLVVGRTFEDLDAEGPGLEGPGVAGYTVYLLDGQGQLVATTRTQTDDPATLEDETGWYHFPDLPAGTYVVAEKKVPGWWQSHPADQGIRLPEPPVNPGVYVVTLSKSQTLEVLDFGNYRSGDAGYARIAGHVYVDVDNDGIFDPQELGLPNVPITIEGPVTRVVTTSEDGSYRADDLPAGVYTLTETQPLIFQDGRDTIGTPRLGTLENDRFMNVELLPDMVAEDYNFGEYGLKVEFIGKRLLLASTPPSSVYLADLQVGNGESLVLLETPATGTLRASARSEGEEPAIQLYDYHWRPVSLISRHGELRAPVVEGAGYLIYVDARVPATVSAALDTAPAPEPVYVYTNVRRAHDVNADGYVSPRDALLLINALNTAGARPLAGVNLSAYYLDVTSDNYLSPLDALLVINVLNQAGGEGEGESGDLVRDRALSEYLAEADASTAQSLEDALGLPSTLHEQPGK